VSRPHVSKPGTGSPPLLLSHGTGGDENEIVWLHDAISPASAPGEIEGREQALYGAYLPAVAFASGGAGLHHKICHNLGGTFLPHAETHAVVLPHVLTLNAPHPLRPTPDWQPRSARPPR
jgi:alcohol dehydrogenase class IV